MSYVLFGIWNCNIADDDFFFVVLVDAQNCRNSLVTLGKFTGRLLME